MFYLFSNLANQILVRVLDVLVCVPVNQIVGGVAQFSYERHERLMFIGAFS